MNLTKWFVAGLCLTAMTVSAAILQSDAFENGEYTLNWKGISGGLNLDVSVFAGDASLDGYSLDRPMTGVPSNRVLRLNTNGFALTNIVNEGSFKYGAVYVDMLVKFVPSVELPLLEPSVKLAVAVTNERLFVTQRGREWIQTDQVITSTNWYRFTTVFKVVTTSNWVEDPFLEEGGGWEIDVRKKAVVRINGNIVKVGGENEFVVADYEGLSTLNSIAFSGAGFIDEVVVRNDDPLGLNKFAGIYPVTDPGKYILWLGVNNITQGEEREEMYNAFLWNVPPDGTVSPALKIGSINVGTDIVLTLMADYAAPGALNVLIDTTNLNNNAVFKVLGKVSLSDSTWHDFGANLTFNPVVPPNTNQFFKADISIP